MKKETKRTADISGPAKASTSLEIPQHSSNIKNKNRKIIYDLTEEECVQLLEKVRWKDGIFCPHCKSKERIVKNGHVRKLYQNYICRNCNHSFTVRTGTVFSHSKIPLKTWFIALISLDQCSIKNISEKLRIEYEAARRLVKKIRKSIFIREMKRKLFGEVIIKIEADETYITAGEKGNKNLKRKPRKRGLKAHPGRGTFEKDKPAIIVITERKNGITKFFVPTHLNRECIVDIFQNHIEGDEIVAYHDDYSIYDWLEGIYQHFTINHSNREYAKGYVHINNAENRFSLFKQFLHKHRGVSKYNLQEYVTLCQFFFNERRESRDPMHILTKFLEYIFFAFFRFSFLQNYKTRKSLINRNRRMSVNLYW